jgi:hypothetical protein
MPTEWVLYSRPGCHLCEEAEEWLAELAAEYGAVLREFNILSDPAVYERYKWQIPVLVIAERQWEAPLDAAQIRAAVQIEGGDGDLP